MSDLREALDVWVAEYVEVLSRRDDLLMEPLEEIVAAARRFLALTETGPICGEEVETYDGPFLCGHVEDEEIHHPVHGHEFVSVYLIPADYLTEEE